MEETAKKEKDGFLPETFLTLKWVILYYIFNDSMKQGHIVILQGRESKVDQTMMTPKLNVNGVMCKVILSLKINSSIFQQLHLHNA